jgi:hypothetical protein
MAFGVGWVFSLALGAVIGGLEAIGVTLGYAVKRQPLIIGPSLATFVLTLMMQTWHYRDGPLSWRIIQEFCARAVWAAFIVSLFGAVALGVIHWMTRRTDESN